MLRLEGVSKTYDGTRILSDIDLTVGAGEFFALLGPSGCGKSSLLRIVGGLTQPDEGRVLLDGIDVTEQPPWRRPVNMMFQSYALFPHLSVYDNIAYGLRRDRLSSQDIDQRVQEMLTMTRMTDFAGRKPVQLSGGQRQRVALARSLAKRPKVLLLDEPLSALDRKLREQTQIELMDIQDRLGTTFVVVTHDQAEAMTLATGMAVMDRGEIYQIGKPAEVYEYPRYRFVADFLGRMNFFSSQYESTEQGQRIFRSGKHRLAVSAAQPEKDNVTLAIRPEKMRIEAGQKTTDLNHFNGVITSRVYTGGKTTYQVKLEDGQNIYIDESNHGVKTRPDLDWDDVVTVSCDPQCIVCLED